MANKSSSQEKAGAGRRGKVSGPRTKKPDALDRERLENGIKKLYEDTLAENIPSQLLDILDETKDKE
jgi:hypothetical protein